MLADRGKISTRQLILLFIMLSFSPAARLFPQLVAAAAKQNGWLSPIVGLLGFIVLVFIVQSFFKKGTGMGLADIYCDILGKILGRMVLVLYLTWILILLSLYFMYYATRNLSSMLTNTDIRFFLIIMAILVFYVVRGGLVTLARLNELLFITFIIIMFTVIGLLLFNVKAENLLPISPYNLVGIAEGSLPILTVWGFFLYMFFLGDMVNDKKHIGKLGVRCGVFITIFSILLLIVTIGTAGYHHIETISLPFFLIVKNISILGIIERIEPILLSIWIISDFVLLSVFSFISVSLLKSIFKFSDDKPFISPVILFAYIFSLLIASSRFELEAFTKIAVYINLILTFGFPIIIFAVGKIRKKI